MTEPRLDPPHPARPATEPPRENFVISPPLMARQLRWYRSSSAWPALAAMLICLATVMLVAIRQGRLRIDDTSLHIDWTFPLMLAGGGLIGSLLIIVHRWSQWSAPMRQLRDTLRRVREGQVPMDDLAKVGGCLTPLAEDVRALFRDLRLAKMDLALLQQEMSQRVANRTDALERSLGTLRHQVTRDALTGVYNRRMFDQCLPDLVLRARAENSSLTLMMIDVDYFKQVNDTLGHAAGDELLRSIGQLLRSTVRDADLPFRFGGDEFCVILPKTPLRGAELLAGRLGSLVEALGKTLRVTPPPRMSIGMVDLAELGRDANAAQMVALADRNLYDVKIARKALPSQGSTARVA